MRVVAVTFAAPDGRILVRTDRAGSIADHGTVDEAQDFYEAIYTASYDLHDPTEAQVKDAANGFRTRFDPRVQSVTVREMESLVMFGLGVESVDPADPSLLYGRRLHPGSGAEFHGRGWTVSGQRGTPEPLATTRLIH